MEVVASLSQGRTAAAQCGLFTHKSVQVIFEPPCSLTFNKGNHERKRTLNCRLLLRQNTRCRAQKLSSLRAQSSRLT